MVMDYQAESRENPSCDRVVTLVLALARLSLSYDRKTGDLEAKGILARGRKSLGLVGPEGFEPPTKGL
jgi:hypothetical protein